MAARSTIDLLPEDIKKQLNSKLAENAFGDYTGLTDWLTEQGFEISRSSLHRYGQKIERRFKAIKASTEAAKLISDGAKDDKDTRSEALMALIQSSLFDVLIDLQELDELDTPKRLSLLSNVGKNIATLTSASTRLKEYQQEVKRALDDKFAELKTTIDPNTLDRIKKEVYGVF